MLDLLDRDEHNMAFPLLPKGFFHFLGKLQNSILHKVIFIDKDALAKVINATF